MNLTVAIAFNTNDLAGTVHSVGLYALHAPRLQSLRNHSATPTVSAAPRSIFQFVDGASRRRAAPRSQFDNAASLALSPFIGYRGPLSTSATAPSLMPSQSSGPCKCNPRPKAYQVKCKCSFCASSVKAILGSIHALRPNRSLNRTHCGVPPFGLEKIGRAHV